MRCSVQCAMFCSVLKCVALCCSVMQCATVCYSVIQCAAVCCSVQFAAACSIVLQCYTARCSVIQCAAVCCRVLPNAAVSCRVLPCAWLSKIPEAPVSRRGRVGWLIATKLRLCARDFWFCTCRGCVPGVLMFQVHVSAATIY